MHAAEELRRINGLPTRHSQSGKHGTVLFAPQIAEAQPKALQKLHILIFDRVVFTPQLEKTASETKGLRQLSLATIVNMAFVTQ